MTSLKDEMWLFVERHPVVTFFVGLAAIGWTTTIAGALIAPCQGRRLG